MFIPLWVFMSGTEVAGLLDAMGSVLYRTIVLTAYGAGLRINEVCSLGIDDIGQDPHTLLNRPGRPRTGPAQPDVCTTAPSRRGRSSSGAVLQTPIRFLGVEPDAIVARLMSPPRWPARP
jgi:integrase